MQRRNRTQHGFCAVVVTIIMAACSGGDADSGEATPAPAVAPAFAAFPRVEIVEPANGAELTGPNVRIVLAAHNILIAPAGDTTPGTGHHHLLVNTPLPEGGVAIPPGVPTVVHLGKAQTSHELTGLAPGEYTVIAVIGDLVHRRVDPQVLDTVRFRVR